MNSLQNIGMLKNCWKELSKRTVDWGEIRVTIEELCKGTGIYTQANQTQTYRAERNIQIRRR